jgi:hypothetical protein
MGGEYEVGGCKEADWVLVFFSSSQARQGTIHNRCATPQLNEDIVAKFSRSTLTLRGL